MEKKTKRMVKMAVLLLAAFMLTGIFSGQANAAAKKKTLVVYFSRTGTTKDVAKKIQKLTGADIVQLKTKKSYPSDYDNMLETAQKEQDENARPELATKISGFKNYDTIVLGYPIWWGMQPMAVNTFLESYHFAGKKVIPFCTSGGSGISDSVRSMKKICKGASFGTGLNATDAGDSRLKEWLKNNKVSLKSTSPKVTLKIGKKNVTEKTYSLKKGSKKTLKVSVSSFKGKKKVKYSSSNQKVAAVTTKGVIKAKKKGTAKIKVTVTSGKKKVSAWMKVKVVRKSTVPVFDFSRKTVKLNSGYQMPLNGIGTYSLLDDVCVDSVSEALKRGVRLIDTAYMYDNEKEVGRAVRESGIPRSKIFVTTKLYPDQYDDPEKAIDDALKRLDIGYIDLMLLHHPGKNDVKAYKAMEKAVKQGKIRSIGLSNWYIKELKEFLPQVSITPAVVQNEIHPYYQESKVIDYVHSLGIVMEGWYPFGGRGYTEELLSDEVISKIAKAHGKSSAQVILRWNLQKGVIVIPGSSNPAHIQENTELYDFKLTDKEMKQINALNRNEKHDWY